jgi:hypothetical protein
MLFLPTFDTRRSLASTSTEHLASQIPGLVSDDWSVPISLTHRPLANLLKAFGNLLPARSSSSNNVASELSKQAFYQSCTVF